MTFHRSVLPNGLRLITVPMKESPTVTVMVLVEAGSKYETKKINGISHFLEHMCFKGTTARPKPIDIVKELDGIGAAYNAFTAQEMTGYYAKSDKKHFATILDVVSDIYLNSTLPEAEMKKEKGVIVEEIKMYKDLPPRRIHEVLMEILYGDQPAGWDIAGSEETVRSFTRKDFLSYRGRHYVSGATAVIVAGAITDKAAKASVRRAFAGMQSGAKDSKVAIAERQEKPALALEEKKTDQVHLAFGLRTCDLYHRGIIPMRVLAAVLGGGMSSRLFQKMRDELGICYYVGASHETFTDHGFLEITAGVPARRLSEAVSALLGEMRKIKEHKVGKEELTRVKEHLIGSLYLGLESSDAVAEFVGSQEIMRKPILAPREVEEKIRAVSPQELILVANDYLVNERLNLALIGPVSKERDMLLQKLSL